MRERRVPIGRAKAHFADLVRRAERGESVVLTRHGRAVARIGPVEGLPTVAEISERPAVYDTDAPEAHLDGDARRSAIERLLAAEVWSRIPADQLGKAPDKRERERILGYGEDGT